ncbi:hypothetical protein D3C84_1139420 [compost metagenome]
MLVKLLDFPGELAERLKSLTHQATASKAVFEAATRYPAAVDCIDTLRRELADERQRNQVLWQRIEAARSAAVQLFELTAQSDIDD